ncbi:MAG: DNA primase [Deltaproteobacteria bacterium]|nr:DNA primase [Deltaproteobacteria bacterium]
MDAYQSAKEEIKRAADIVQLIGEFVQLRKAGQNYVGLCPFHSEKDPSFSVNSARQMFHCFGCKKGGDVFAFWMEYHKTTFPEAMTDLAQKYQVPLPKKPLTPSQKGKEALKKTIFKANALAAEFFHSTLLESEKGLDGKKYFDERSLNEEIISVFRLGYAPNQWDGLTRFLKSKQVDLKKAEIAGLIIPKKSGGYYDRFRNRAIFPIYSMRDQVVGFGGRVLDGSLPKYLNTPETPVFHKGELLYGLHLAHRAIREASLAVIVEGYTDVLALAKHNFHLAVATLGTSLTREHIRMLKGYARDAVVVFDADAAGQAAVLKSMALFLKEGLSAKVLVLPPGEDPDSFVNKNGLAPFRRLLESSIPIFDFYIDLQLTGAGDQIEGQLDLLREIFPLLEELENAAQRSFYMRRLSGKLNINETALLEELGKWRARGSPKRGNAPLRARPSSEKTNELDDINDGYLLNLLAHHPHTVESLVKYDCRALISDPVIRDIYELIADLSSEENILEPSQILERLDGEVIQERFREAMLSPSIFPDDSLDQVLKGFEHRILQIKMEASKAKAKEQLDLKELNKILKFKKATENQYL